MSAEALFQHLCKVVDSPEIDQTSRLYRISKQLIIDGKKNLLYSQFIYLQWVLIGVLLGLIIIAPAFIYSFRLSVRPFVCSYVRSFVRLFVLPSVTWNLRQSFALKFLKLCISQQLLIRKHSY